MRKHFIALGLLLILACVASCYANNGKEQDTASATKMKTGDIEVTAWGCEDPPKHGPKRKRLELKLNKMPGRESMHIPTWIKPYPAVIEERDKWFRELEDSLFQSPDKIRVLEFLYDSLGIGRVIMKNVEFFDQLSVAEGITDSLGHYIFKNVPIGRYQLICENIAQIDTQAIQVKYDSTDDTLPSFDHSKLRHPELPNALGPETPIPERTGWGYWGIYPGTVDDVRVAQDSVSIVGLKLNCPHMAEELLTNFAQSWTPKFKKREK